MTCLGSALAPCVRAAYRVYGPARLYRAMPPHSDAWL